MKLVSRPVPGQPCVCRLLHAEGLRYRSALGLAPGRGDRDLQHRLLWPKGRGLIPLSRDTFRVLYAKIQGAGPCARPPSTLEYVMQRIPRPHRKSTRLPHFDYSQPGAYFLTICTHNRACIFGHIEHDTLLLNLIGHEIRTIWMEMPAFYHGLAIDYFVLMPNHLHAIVFLTRSPLPEPQSPGGRAQGPAPTLGLHDVVQRFKSLTTARVRQLHVRAAGSPRPPSPLWQRGYYEHVVRNDGSLERIREYIANNPAKWALDRENPLFVPPRTPPADAERWMA